MGLFTTNRGLYSPAVNETGWGTLVDANWSVLDGALLAKALSGSTGSLTTFQAQQNSAFKFTGALSGDCTVTIPAKLLVYLVQNATTGGHNVVLTTGSGATVTLLPNTTAYFEVFCDGTNVYTAGDGTGSPGGSSGDLQYNNSGSFGGFADGTSTQVLHGGKTFSSVVEADQSLSDVTTLNVSTSKHGYTPKLPNDAHKYLDGTGAYSVPSGVAGVNSQTGTTYTFVEGDEQFLVTFANALAIAASLPQAGSGGNFLAAWYVFVENTGVGTLTITPTTSTIDGHATLVLTQGEGAVIVSDGTNYFTMSGTVPSGGFPASVITSGLLALARGGTNADLSASGGSTMVLAQDASHVISARNLVAGDIPSLAASIITSGLLALARGGTGVDLSASGSATAFLAQDGSHVVSARSIIAADVPTLNQNTSGTASNLSGTPALPNGTTATTQTPGDGSTKLATDAYADASVVAGPPVFKTAGIGFVSAGVGHAFPAGGSTLGVNASALVYSWATQLLAPLTVRKCAFEVTVLKAGASVSIGIWDSGGNKLVDFGAVSVATTGAKTASLGSPVTLAPGLYFIGWAGDDTTNTCTLLASFYGGATTTNANDVINKNVTRAFRSTNALSAGVLPSTLGASTQTFTKAGQIPVGAILIES